MKLNIEKNDLLQWIRYTAGLAICGFVIYCLTKTELGLAPWEILSKGISMHCPLSFGQVIIAVSVVVFIIDLLMKEVIGVGMILDTILVGVFADLFTWLDLMPAFNGYIVKICVYIAGLEQVTIIHGRGEGIGIGAVLSQKRQSVVTVRQIKHLVFQIMGYAGWGVVSDAIQCKAAVSPAVIGRKDRVKA